MSLYQKLNKIQNEMKVLKSRYNDFNNFYYRSCEDIFDAVKPLLLKENLSLFVLDNIIQVGNRYYVEAIAVLTDNESTEKIEVKAYARETETKKGYDESQITGSASSYARKYALNGLFLLDDNKDADYDDNRNQTSNKYTANTNKSNKVLAKTILEIGSDAFLKAMDYMKTDEANIEKIKSKYILSKEAEEKLLSVKKA